MRMNRRLVALIALVGVGWAALWPVVAVAHAAAMDEAVPLCHQAGMMVAPGEMPDGPQAPGNERGRTHCPLCIMAFYGVFHAPLAAPPFTFSTGFVNLQTYCAALPFGIEVRLPESRAPPRSPTLS